MEEGLTIEPPLIVLESIGSTNDYVKKNRDRLAHFQGVLANEQTAGKGRMGRHWLAQRDDALNLSVLLIPRKGTELVTETECLSLLCALAVAEAIEQITDLDTQIKWPNDVLIRGKKVSGILVENVFGEKGGGCTVVGIGVNVNAECFPEEIRNKAVSLSQLLGRRMEIIPLAQRILGVLRQKLEHCDRRALILNDYIRRCITIGSDICTISSAGELWGRAVGIQEDGALLVMTPEGEQVAFYSGEVSVRTSRGYV